jgi:hypothetical protein
MQGMKVHPSVFVLTLCELMLLPASQWVPGWQRFQ